MLAALGVPDYTAKESWSGIPGVWFWVRELWFLPLLKLEKLYQKFKKLEFLSHFFLTREVTEKETKNNLVWKVWLEPQGWFSLIQWPPSPSVENLEAEVMVVPSNKQFCNLEIHTLSASMLPLELFLPKIMKRKVPGSEVGRWTYKIYKPSPTWEARCTASGWMVDDVMIFSRRGLEWCCRTQWWKVSGHAKFLPSTQELTGSRCSLGMGFFLVRKKKPPKRSNGRPMTFNYVLPGPTPSAEQKPGFEVSCWVWVVC